jgi:hypothetical protein
MVKNSPKINATEHAITGPTAAHGRQAIIWQQDV